MNKEHAISPRYWFVMLLATIAPNGYLLAQGTDEPPTRYEISINGEHFTVDGDRVTKLNSAEKKGTSYEVAVRVSSLQRWVLNAVQFDYDRGFAVTDDHKSPVRTATLKHGLGFVMLVTDLGGPTTPETQQKGLADLAASLEKSYQDSGATKIEATKPEQRKLGSTEVRGLTIRYDDADAVGHTTLLYLVAGENFACSVVTQCLEADREDVQPLIRSTLKSFQPRAAIAARPAKPAKE